MSGLCGRRNRRLSCAWNGPGRSGLSGQAFDPRTTVSAYRLCAPFAGQTQPNKASASFPGAATPPGPRVVGASKRLQLFWARLAEIPQRIDVFVDPIRPHFVQCDVRREIRVDDDPNHCVGGLHDFRRGQKAFPVVCPAKAGMFSRRKACRGKSQKPRSLDSRVAGNQDSEAYRQRLPRGDDEPPGRNESKRECGLENA